jgi:predicted permease
VKPTPRHEVDDELAFHLEMRTREYVERGLDPKLARETAIARFGDFEDVRRSCRTIAEGRERDMRRREWRDELKEDLAFAWRQLVKHPGFTGVAVGTLALGMGATAAIFSALYAVVLSPLPYARPDEIVDVATTWRDRPGNVSAGNYLYIREHSRSFRALSAMQFSSLNLDEGDNPERVVGGRATFDHFDVFGVPPLLGRVFTEDEDQPGRNQVVVLSHRLWKRRFGADPSMVGRQVRLGGVPHEVIGVMPASFDLTADSEELWVPMAFTPERRQMYDEHMYRVSGRLREGVTLAQAGADMGRVAQALVRDHPKDNVERSAIVRSFAGTVVGVYRERLWLLLGAVGLVLLIACANVASLLLARGAARGRELAVRTALGAGRSRLVRQMLTESLLLAGLGALAGLAVGWAAVALILKGSPPGVPRLEQVTVGGPVLAFTASLALFTSLVFGLVPALRASRQDVRGDLGAGGRGGVLGGARDRLRRSLVAAEVALCLVLLAAAGLLIRSALKLQDVDPGFDPTGVLSARITLPPSAYPGHERPARAFERMAERLRQAPGVASAAASSLVPMGGGGGGSNGLIPEGRPLELKGAIDATRYAVTPDYFQTMRIPLRRGRAFTAEDRRGAPRVMIVNETLARTAWPGQDPLGKRIVCCEGTPDNPGWKTVVGVAADVRTRGLGVEVRPEFYLPLDQIPPEAWDWMQRSMTLIARTPDVAPESLTPALRHAVREVDPTVPVFNVATMSSRIHGSTAQARFNTQLLTALGAVGLALAAVGIYGVIAYFVAQRTREIGVRMALGARGRDVVALVLRQALATVAVGIAIGIPAAVLAGRALGTMLFDVGSADPLTLTSVVAVLLVVAFVASGLPARRAVQVQPTEALSEG